MNRNEFSKKRPSVYLWLLKNNPSALDSVFPKIDQCASTQRHLEENYYAKGKLPSKKSRLRQLHAKYHVPSQSKRFGAWSMRMKKKYPEVFVKETVKSRKQELELLFYKKSKRPKESHRLYNAHISYTRPYSDSYDRAWTELMKTKYPKAFESIVEAGLNKMLQKMPPGVSFVSGQKWIGVESKYIFNDNRFGKFTAKAGRLMRRVWPKGLSGHPRDGKHSSATKKCKPVICLETGEVFLSAKAVADHLNLKSQSNLKRAIDHRKKFGGFHWSYS